MAMHPSFVIVIVAQLEIAQHPTPALGPSIAHVQRMYVVAT